jgi:protoheme IX farnesyltransferase
MPPVLGWAAVTGEISSDALLLFLIIFAWTPPHFGRWRCTASTKYARAGVPMLPVTRRALHATLTSFSTRCCSR